MESRKSRNLAKTEAYDFFLRCRRDTLVILIVVIVIVNIIITNIIVLVIDIIFTIVITATIILLRFDKHFFFYHGKKRYVYWVLVSQKNFYDFSIDKGTLECETDRQKKHHLESFFQPRGILITKMKMQILRAG